MSFVGGKNVQRGKTSQYEHTQGAANTIWTITHNLNRYPNVQTFDATGNIMLGDVKHLTINTVTVTFVTSLTGTAILD